MARILGSVGLDQDRRNEHADFFSTARATARTTSGDAFFRNLKSAIFVLTI
jgi:hypothetical protein